MPGSRTLKLAAPDSMHFHLLCAADAAYGPWTGVMISSILAQDHGWPVHILLSDGVRANDQQRMAAIAKGAGAQFSAYDLGTTLAPFEPISCVLPYITRAAVARLLFDRFLPLETGPLLYCDSDIICLGPLRELWQYDLEGAIVGAVPNGSEPGGKDRSHNRLLDLPTEHLYANSGVLLIDVARWRAARIGDRARDFIEKNADRLLIPDQDALNAVLGAHIRTLPPWWNFQVGGFSLEQDCPIALVHFAGPAKPWFVGYRRQFGAAFREAKRNSPWRYTPPIIPWQRIGQRWLRSIGKRYRSLARLRPPDGKTPRRLP